MSIPLCCPHSYQPKSSKKDANTRSMSSSEEPSEETEPCQGQVLGKCYKSNNKPIEEWEKLGKKCPNEQVWLPLKDKRGEQCACNPRQLSDLQAMRERIENRARSAGPSLTWDEFNGGALDSYTDAEQLAAQQANEHRFVVLTQADFASGTVRLRAGGYFRLEEDISFDPNASAPYWLDRRAPLAAQRAPGALYSSDAYTRGFFAALTIEGSEIFLDLNGHTFEHSDFSVVRQRFQSVIELADQPFIGGQGPGDFGSSVAMAKNSVVANGTLGHSSHHGIHGNLCSNVLIEDVVFERYEVCGIALNGVTNVAINNCHMTGTDQAVVFNALLSSAIFSLLDAQALIVLADSESVPSGDLTSAAAGVEAILQPIIESGVVDARSPLANGSCTLPDGTEARLIDGNAYGVLINSRGVAVNGFDEEASALDDNMPDSEQVLIVDTKIDKTFANVDEVPALFDTRDGQAGPIVDTSGALIRLSSYYDCEQELFGIDNFANDFADTMAMLLRMQLHIVKLREEVRAAITPNEEPLAPFEVARVPTEVLALLDFDLACSQLPFANGDLVWKRNGDSMFHVNKGVFGGLWQGVSLLCVRNVEINEVANCGERGRFCPLPCEILDESKCTIIQPDDECCDLGDSGQPLNSMLQRTPYTSAEDGGHPAQGSMFGYGGADSYGVVVSAATTFDISKVCIKDVYSAHGSAFGLVLQYQSNGGKVNCVSIDGVHAAAEACEVDFSQGAKAPLAQGVRIDTSSTKIVMHKPAVSDVTATGGAACRCCINSAGVAVTI